MLETVLGRPGGGARLAPEGLLGRAPRGEPGRGDAKDEAGDDRDHEGEAKDPPVERDRDVIPEQVPDQAVGPGPEEQAGAGADQSEDRALKEEREHEVEPTGPERDPDRELGGAAEGAGQLQAGQVRAGNQYSRFWEAAMSEPAKSRRTIPSSWFSRG